MPANITDVSAFTDPIVRPVDTDVRNAASVQPSFQGLANRTRMLLDRIDAVIPRSGGNVDEYLYPSTKTRSVLVPLYANARTSTSTTDDWSRAGSLSTQHLWASGAPNVPLLYPLNAYLPHGAVLQSVKVVVDPTAAQAILINRMLASLQYAAPVFSGSPPPVPAVVSVGDAYDDGTANRQVITISAGMPHTVEKKGASAREYELIVYASASAAGDLVHAIQLTFTDPGPRNY